MTQEYLSFTEEQAGAFFHHPSPDDDKYRRGVVGLVVGSETYPGAGLLASFAAAHSGVGMVRLNAPRRVEDLVLSQVPGVVTRGGRIQAGLVGPGCDSERSDDCAELARFCVDSQLPLVIDAGALDQVVGLVDYAKRQGRSLTRTVLTPHHGEAARLLSQLGAQTSRAKVDDDPHAAAASLGELTGAVVVLKSSRTLCVYAEYTEGRRNLKGIEIPQETPWAGVAGSGDVLAGIIAAVLAMHQGRAEKQGSGSTIAEADCGHCACAGVWLHSQAARVASRGENSVLRPIQALDIARAIPDIVGAVCS